METTPGSNGSGPLETPAPTLTLPPEPPLMNRILKGPNGLRAGWRIFLYIVIVVILSSTTRFVVRKITHPPQHRQKLTLDLPGQTIRGEWIGFAISALAALIMARIEKQRWGNYGMPWRNALRSRFWFGAVFGFAGLSCVMLSLHLAHCYYIDGLALHGAEIWKYAGLWMLAFVGVGFFEEFTARGYLQYTLSSGIGFWISAVITSALFFVGHIGNSGENILGLIDVFLFGMLACFIWWRTGDLWLAVGFHAFWDWGLSFFYSVPDSGIPAMGHLFNIRMQGPAWLSGGNAGPEGSAINLVFDLLYFVIIALIFPKKQFVDMNERRLAAKASAEMRQEVVIDSTALNS